MMEASAFKVAERVPLKVGEEPSQFHAYLATESRIKSGHLLDARRSWSSRGGASVQGRLYPVHDCRTGR